MNNFTESTDGPSVVLERLQIPDTSVFSNVAVDLSDSTELKPSQTKGAAPGLETDR